MRGKIQNSGEWPFITRSSGLSGYVEDARKPPDHLIDNKTAKKCNRCNKTLSDEMFYRAEGFSDGFDCLCKECRHIVDHSGVERLSAKQIKKFVNQKKDMATCKRCGSSNLPAKAMRFVYRKGEMKSFSLSRPPRVLDMVSIVAELKKCDLLCANCASLRK